MSTSRSATNYSLLGLPIDRIVVVGYAVLFDMVVSSLGRIQRQGCSYRF